MEAAVKTMGIVPVACLAAREGDRGLSHEDVNLERNQLGRESGRSVGLPLGISVFDQDVAALDVTEVTHFLGRKASCRWGLAAGSAAR